MGIYQRDNINYGGMLGNAMANRMAYAQRDADIQRQMGQNWANAINQGAQGIAAGLNTWNQQRIEQDKLAQQQQFQAEQKALERANEISRAQQQQKWQAEQNALQRQSTERIAMQKWQEAQDEKNSVNQAKDNLGYQLEKAMLAQYEDSLGRTEDPIKRAELQGRINASKLKIADYESRYPQFNPQPTVAVPEQAPVFSQEFLNEVQPQETKPDLVHETIATLSTRIADSNDPKVIDDSIATLESQNRDVLDVKEREGLKKTIEDAKAKSAKIKNAKAVRAEAQASYDALPKLSNGSVKPGSLAKWKKAHPNYAKALGK